MYTSLLLYAHHISESQVEPRNSDVNSSGRCGGLSTVLSAAARGLESCSSISSEAREGEVVRQRSAVRLSRLPCYQRRWLLLLLLVLLFHCYYMLLLLLVIFYYS